MAEPVEPSGDAQRLELVRLAQETLKRGELPAAYNAVVVVTDAEGAWCGVASSCGNAYTRRLLIAALEGAEQRFHARQPAEGG